MSSVVLLDRRMLLGKSTATIYMRSRVLSLNGMSLSDFKTTAEAMKTADALVADNKKELGHDFPGNPPREPLAGAGVLCLRPRQKAKLDNQ